MHELHERQRWIVIPKWDGPDGFQHYKDRDPRWIKTYTRLLRKDEYLDLSGHERAILHGIWLLYASSGGSVREDTAKLSRSLNLRVLNSHLESLNHAGFIQFRASRPLAQRKSKRHKDLLNGVKKPQTRKANASRARELAQRLKDNT